MQFHRFDRVVSRAFVGLVAGFLWASTPACSADESGMDAHTADHASTDATRDVFVAEHAPDVPQPFDSAVDCPGHLTCDDCREVGCGWCLTTNHCVPGGATGSADGTCMGAAWAYTLAQCVGSDGSVGPMDAAPGLDSGG